MWLSGKNLTSIHEDVGLILGLHQWVNNLTSIHEDVGLSPGLGRLKDLATAVSCGVGHRHSLDLVLLWLWV